MHCIVVSCNNTGRPLLPGSKTRSPPVLHLVPTLLHNALEHLCTKLCMYVRDTCSDRCNLLPEQTRDETAQAKGQGSVKQPYLPCLIGAHRFSFLQATPIPLCLRRPNTSSRLPKSPCFSFTVTECPAGGWVGYLSEPAFKNAFISVKRPSFCIFACRLLTPGRHTHAHTSGSLSQRMQKGLHSPTLPFLTVHPHDRTYPKCLTGPSMRSRRRHIHTPPVAAGTSP